MDSDWEQASVGLRTNSGVAMSQIIALLGMLVGSPPEDPVALDPAGSWTADYADAQCFLSRDFGTGKDRIMLGFGLLPGAESDEIYLLEPERDSPQLRRTQVEIDFGSGRQPIKETGASTRNSAGGRITRITPKAAQLAAFRTATTIDITSDGKRYRLKLSAMKAAFAASDACEQDLVRKWGLDPALLTDAATPATPVPGSEPWITYDDYPPEAIRAGKGGLTVFRLDVDAKGAVGGCTIVASSGSEALDKQTCLLMRKRARFNPARRADGTAVPTIWINRARWAVSRG